jgi:toxin ParE1/3/4
MQVRWSPASAEDLEQIFNYIRTDNPAAAQRVAQTIYDRAGALGTDLYLGRRGRVEGTRELPLPPLPFIVVYRVLEQLDVIEIVNVIHGAQRWPPAT